MNVASWIHKCTVLIWLACLPLTPRYLRSLPEGLAEVKIPISLIHALLLKLASISMEDLQKSSLQAAISNVIH
jgi:hypothetical protein